MSTRLLLGLFLGGPNLNLVLQKFKLLLFQVVNITMLWQALWLCVICSDSVFYSYIKHFYKNSFLLPFIPVVEELSCCQKESSS